MDHDVTDCHSHDAQMSLQGLVMVKQIVHELIPALTTHELHDLFHVVSNAWNSLNEQALCNVNAHLLELFQGRLGKLFNPHNREADTEEILRMTHINDRYDARDTYAPSPPVLFKIQMVTLHKSEQRETVLLYVHIYENRQENGLVAVCNCLRNPNFEDECIYEDERDGRWYSKRLNVMSDNMSLELLALFKELYVKRASILRIYHSTTV